MSEKQEVVSVLFTRNHRCLPIELYYCITGKGYTHASISTDSTLTNFYSFTYRGFKEEHPAHRRLTGKTKGSLCLQFYVDHDEYLQLYQKLTELQETGCPFNWLGYLLTMLHIRLPFKIGKGYFCSEFVAAMLSDMSSFNLPKAAWHYRPTGLAVDLQLRANPFRVLVDKL